MFCMQAHPLFPWTLQKGYTENTTLVWPDWPYYMHILPQLILVIPWSQRNSVTINRLITASRHWTTRIACWTRCNLKCRPRSGPRQGSSPTWSIGCCSRHCVKCKYHFPWRSCHCVLPIGSCWNTSTCNDDSAAGAHQFPDVLSW